MADDSTFDKIAGKAKETTGKVTNDTDLEAEGKLQHSEGKAKEFVEDAKSGLKAAAEKLKDTFDK